MSLEELQYAYGVRRAFVWGLFAHTEALNYHPAIQIDNLIIGRVVQSKVIGQHLHIIGLIEDYVDFTNLYWDVALFPPHFPACSLLRKGPRQQRVREYYQLDVA